VTTAQIFVSNLVTILADRGLSQRALAEKMNCAHPHINRIINHKACPTLDFVERVAEAVNVPVPKLLEDTHSGRKITGKFSK